MLEDSFKCPVCKSDKEKIIPVKQHNGIRGSDWAEWTTHYYCSNCGVMLAKHIVEYKPPVFK